ncbi:MAG: hypothetical protein JWM11_6938 [Planctomycetaceae bacterium]|nr:hypothetical protein [Planctomycetaceae bacterium]
MTGQRDDRIERSPIRSSDNYRICQTSVPDCSLQIMEVWS